MLFRSGLPVFGAAYVVEAEAGAFARWGLHVGDELEYRGQEPDDMEAM